MKFVSSMVLGFLLLLALLSLQWIGPFASAGATMPRSASAAGLQDVQQERQELLALQVALDQLQQLHSLTVPEPNPLAVARTLTQAEIEQANQAARQAAEPEAAPESLPQRRLTLIYTAPGYASAMLDGKLVRAGDMLADGARVLRIDVAGLVIEEANGQRQHLSSPNPTPLSAVY